MNIFYESWKCYDFVVIGGLICVKMVVDVWWVFGCVCVGLMFDDL